MTTEGTLRTVGGRNGVYLSSNCFCQCAHVIIALTMAAGRPARHAHENLWKPAQVLSGAAGRNKGEQGCIAPLLIHLWAPPLTLPCASTVFPRRGVPNARTFAHRGSRRHCGAFLLCWRSTAPCRGSVPLPTLAPKTCKGFEHAHGFNTSPSHIFPALPLRMSTAAFGRPRPTSACRRSRSRPARPRAARRRPAVPSRGFPRA